MSVLFSWLKERSFGVLLHPTCFPGNQGIGVLDQHAVDFLDFLQKCGIGKWQICPLGPTGFGDSPYQCFSVFAGNPYLVDLEQLVACGLLDKDDLHPLRDLPREKVDFYQIYVLKRPLLLKAFGKFQELTQNDPSTLTPYGNFGEFKERHSEWLAPYSLFLALKDHFEGKPWWDWPEELRFYSGALKSKLISSPAIQAASEAHAFYQYIFFGQWGKIKEAARERDIEIIGDAPIFVAQDSADVWSNPQLFQIDQDSGEPLFVAGVPPDYFSEDGQHWGNPLYDWPAHKKQKYSWWIKRLRACLEFCDILRIDHFRAFDTYWQIPATAPDARSGTWKPGPGIEFFDTVKSALPDCRLIAEDLGLLLPSVHELLDDTGLPGMAVLQFAFADDSGNAYLPHNLSPNSILYSGTHDNTTTRDWYQNASEKERDHVRRYLNIRGDEINWDFIRVACKSVSRIAVIPLQDMLGLGNEGRFNTPGHPLGNWQWRYTEEQLHKLESESAAYLRSQLELYGRLAS